MTSTLTPARGVEIGSPIRVLIAEDETHLGLILEQFMRARGFAVTMVRNGRAALELLRTDAFDVALLDIVMPELDGLEVLRLVREQPTPPEIIVITGNGTIETALAALKLGAYDFLSKPYRMAEIEALVRRAWEKRMLARDNVVLQRRLQHGASAPTFLTQYAPMVTVLSLIKQVAPSASPVLVAGEPGTGKDLIARVVHAHGADPEGPFIDLDCAALTEASFDAELFGAEPSALPGAEQRRVGLIELAAGGTIYLENIGALERTLQAKLLAVLETGRFARVGGTQHVEMNVRVVASTTQDLSRMVANGEFLEALLHRINAIRIVLPPLRERLVDVSILAQHFLADLGGVRPPVLSQDAYAALEKYRWPGNVRELRNVLERAVLLAVNGTISASDLPLGVGPVERHTPTSTVTLVELERRHIRDVLDRLGWHQGRAAESLGISPKTLYRKIREYGFRRPPGRGA